MTVAPERMWSMMLAGSEELAEELGLEAPPDVFAPTRATTAIDLWLRDREAPLDEEETAQLGFFLARVLVEPHGGGLALVRAGDHPLAGEWAETGFALGVAHDDHRPLRGSAGRE